MLEKYMEEQLVATSLLKNSLLQNKVVQAYLFYSNDINYIFKYAKDFCKEIICNKDDSNYENICLKIDNDIYTELKIVEPINDCIKKEQLISLQNEVKNKPVLGNKIVYIIKNCEKLNISAANSILKFLEEPNDDIIAILLTDNINLVFPTIRSRCQIINFKNVKKLINNKSTYYLLSDLLNKNIENLEEEKFNDIINTTIDFAESIEMKKINTIINIKKLIWDKLDNKSHYNIFFNTLIYYYFDVLYKKINRKIKYFYDFSESIEKVCEKNTVENIIEKITIIEKIKSQSFYNTNLKLLTDKLVIELSDVNEE